MNRRDWMRLSGASLAAAAFAPKLLAAADSAKGFTLPPLPYPADALEPAIDKQTMEIHHGKHHASYVEKLNAALMGSPELLATPIETLLRDLSKLPATVRTAVQNNGGGHYNHSLFWQLMAPKAGGTPTGPLGDAIAKSFGDFAGFRTKFAEAAAGRFGSGWAWLVKADGKLAIVSTANQDTPIGQGQMPILGLDVWEHAYYLKYQNKRPAYVEAWWSVVNWKKAGELYSAS